MRKVLLSLIVVAAVLTLAGATFGQQKKQTKCEIGPNRPRNWEQIEDRYIYFDYVLCPADPDAARPLIRIWLTRGDTGIAVEKWAQNRDVADTITVFEGQKKLYTLYRDLDAVPLKVFKAESRSRVPAEMAKHSFLAQGSSLIPLENLTPESAERAARAFRNADTAMEAARRKLPLLPEAPRLGTIIKDLDRPLEAQK